MIGIIGAMDIEVRALCGMLTDARIETHSGTQFHVGRLGDCPVVIARSGIGKVAAAVCAEAMLLVYKPQLLINTGVAGALSCELSIGDMVVSSCAVQYDMDTSPLGDPVGFLSGIDRIRLMADEDAVTRLADAAKATGAHALVGTVASADRFVASREEKERIVRLFPDALCCEMEGGAIAHAACLNGTPFVILRAISDTADDSSHMDYPTFVAHAAETSTRTVVEFLRCHTR